jgi:hypothetical protein
LDADNVNKAMGALTQVFGFVLLTIAAVSLAIQLRDGASWRELELLLPLCLGGAGFGLGFGPLLGLWEVAEAHAGSSSGGESDADESESE